MAHFIKSIITVIKNIKFTIIGAIAIVFLSIFCILSLPVYIYRWIISKVLITCFFRRNTVKAVNAASNVALLDVVQQKHSPRCGIIITMVVDAFVSHDEFYQKVNEKWINAKYKDGKLKYPEFQQYLDSWMGVIFWNPDKDFNLKNHVKHHVLDENGRDLESERFLVDFGEKLINEKFPPKRSPWELHLVHNYKNSGILYEEKGSSESRNLTLCIFHVHHVMVDGYANMHLLLEELAGNPLEEMMLARPSMNRNTSFLKRLYNIIAFPFQVLKTLGSLSEWGCKVDSVFSIPDSKKQWSQVYARAPFIPIGKVKRVKKAFGVSFASVLNSAVGASLGRMAKKLHAEGRGGKPPKNLLYGVAIPKPNHPKKLRVHTLGVAFPVPVKPNMDPIDRLLKCEKNGLKIRDSPLVLLAGIGLKIASWHLHPVSRFLMKNRYIVTGTTNFPGPAIPATWYGGPKCLAMDFGAGIMEGIAGVGFMALSYRDNIQICGTAERAVMSREELNELLQYVCEEIDILDELAVNASADSRENDRLIINQFSVENEKK